MCKRDCPAKIVVADRLSKKHKHNTQNGHPSRKPLIPKTDPARKLAQTHDPTASRQEATTIANTEDTCKKSPRPWPINTKPLHIDHQPPTMTHAGIIATQGKSNTTQAKHMDVKNQTLESPCTTTIELQSTAQPGAPRRRPDHGQERISPKQHQTGANPTKQQAARKHPHQPQGEREQGHQRAQRTCPRSQTAGKKTRYPKRWRQLIRYTTQHRRYQQVSSLPPHNSNIIAQLDKVRTPLSKIKNTPHTHTPHDVAHSTSNRHWIRNPNYHKNIYLSRQIKTTNPTWTK